MVLFSLLLAVLPALVLGQYLVDMVRDLRHDWPKLRRDIRELYCDCWRTPRDKNAK